MTERHTGEGRQDRWATQDDPTYDTGTTTERGVTRSTQQNDLEQGGRSSGNWTGYVVPYRYYGQGYRGVGYYSVFYQGSDEPGRGQDWDRNQEGRSSQRGSVGYGGYGAGQGTGGFQGRGPKGYQRSDERIREDISDQLMADDQIDASDIEVKVQKGEVTLSGTVHDRWIKRRAEDLVDGVMGVREVMNQIRVSSSQTDKYGQRGETGQYGQTGRTGQTGQKAGSTTTATADPASGEPNGRQKAGTTTR